MPRLVRPALVTAFLAAVGLLSAGVLAYGYRQALDQVAARGEADLALAADRLATQLARYRETAVLLSDHPFLAALHDAGGSRVEAEALLQAAVDKTSALAAFYADAAGQVLAATRGPIPDTVTETAYFERAMQGALGSGPGLMPQTGQRAYIYAAPSFDRSGAVRGALVVVVNIDHIEREWRGSRPAVFFTDTANKVFVTNRSELLFYKVVPGALLAPDGTRMPLALHSTGGHVIWTQALSPYVPASALHLEVPLPAIGMLGEALVDVEPARRLALLQAAAVAALCLVFGAALLIVTARRRALAEANAVLEDRVAARTQALEDTNRALRREVAEREEAQAALTRAQADLVQAGKLSALGQMSAGISHELNQPLMAIRSFAENAVAFLDRGKPERAAENLGRISDMARRMGRIIANLRAFARQETAAVARVDLRGVLDSAVELTETRIRAAAVALDYRRPEAPIWVRGGEVRLGQVFVNLITNAVDAMEAASERRLQIAVSDGPVLAVTVRDSGPGIEAPEKLFEPFYTTKAVGGGDGMGLGLSISYGLVQSFGGTIRGTNAPGGGAVFTVELERWREEAAA